jgi:hypothetical protein
MRSRILVFLLMFLIFQSFTSFDTDGENYSYENIRIRRGSYYLKMIHVEAGGSLDLELRTDRKIDIYILEESKSDEVLDFLRNGEEIGSPLGKASIEGNGSLVVDARRSGNMVILLLYDYSTAPVIVDGQVASIEMDASTEKPDKKSNFDPSLLLFLLIPLIAILAVAYWIRRRV